MRSGRPAERAAHPARAVPGAMKSLRLPPGDRRDAQRKARLRGPRIPRRAVPGTMIILHFPQHVAAGKYQCP